MVLTAAWQWFNRPKRGEPAELPKWMNAVDRLTFARAFGLGVLSSGFNPKNLLMCLGAGDTIGAAHLPAVQAVLTMAVFTVVASGAIAAPVIGYLSARDRAVRPLSRLRAWLTRNNATVLAVVLLVIGVALAGHGISALIR
jgi:threonine/homoserine/homoserine lactone efflux protein